MTFLNTGSEATSLAIRIGRAITTRQHIIVMQGGYNGNHDELACNVFNSLAEIGPEPPVGGPFPLCRGITPILPTVDPFGARPAPLRVRT